MYPWRALLINMYNYLHIPHIRCLARRRAICLPKCHPSSPLLITRVGFRMVESCSHFQGPMARAWFKIGDGSMFLHGNKGTLLCRWTTRWLVLHKAALISSTVTAIIVLGKLGSPDNSMHIMVMSAGEARATTMRSNDPTVGILVVSLYDEARPTKTLTVGLPRSRKSTC